MNIIPAKYEIIDIPSPNDKMAVLKHIEKIARTCYKSEDRITDTSCIKMIENLKNRKHWAMLEHYVFVMKVSHEVADSIIEIINDIKKYDVDLDAYNSFKFLNVTTNYTNPYGEYQNIVSVSATTINYLTEFIDRYDEVDYLNGLGLLRRFLYNHYPELINKPIDLIITDTQKDQLNEYLSSDFKFIDSKDLANIEYAQYEHRLIHEYMTVKFTVDRGVSHEIVRHRMASYAQESTRYCNYSKDGFGGEITVIVPNFFRPNTTEYDCWKRTCKMAEHEYFELLRLGATPQQARSVLPNSLKTEIIMTANLQEWIHFFKMRVPMSAHPQMREVTIPLFKQLINDKPEIFERHKYFLEENEVTK